MESGITIRGQKSGTQNEKNIPRQDPDIPVLDFSMDIYFRINAPQKGGGGNDRSHSLLCPIQGIPGGLGNLARTSLTTHLGILSLTASIRSPSSILRARQTGSFQRPHFLRPLQQVLQSFLLRTWFCTWAARNPRCSRLSVVTHGVCRHYMHIVGSICCSSAVETIKGIYLSSKHEYT